jgi:ubiquinone/menaquinone biosynthesis C-methylase UbiE
MSTAAKPYKGLGMEGWIARQYARDTGKSMAAYRSEARRVAALVPSGATVLEVAPGPGYFAIELAKLGDYRVTGLDISRTFVEMARRNAAGAGTRVEFRLGSASEMPFDDGQFDFLFCRAAFKNFSRPVKALEEMRRVLKPGGRGLIVDLRRDASLKAINEEVARMGLGVFSAWNTRMAFRFCLIKRAYTKAEFEHLLAQTTFGRGEIVESGMGMEIWLRK